MYRRRRPKREIPFSFDSFLDVVANVCGIIIRLILVAWVGARLYHAVAARQLSESAVDAATAPVLTAEAKLASTADPLEAALERQRQELARQQQRLAAQLRRFEDLQSANAETEKKLTVLTSTQKAVEEKRSAVDRMVQQYASGPAHSLSLDELTKRMRQVEIELREVEQSPPVTKTLHYRTPVSRPVHTEELHFECRNGRISYIDVQAFLVDIRRGLEDRAKELKTRWEVEGRTGAIGAFRLVYVVERERGLLDAAGMPNPEANFRYGLSAWMVEPIVLIRGEATESALAVGSTFRRIVDSIDPEQAVVTLWVYPDSFGLYRQVRDVLHERGVEVAGRPLPDGVPIASSRQGSASRGQS